ncbi:hypothetical protein ALMP_29370 [Streptomyces sp. A012304]|nr:hypothetical protein ALMP_29370 [Streptomyces sp. A012304]
MCGAGGLTDDFGDRFSEVCHCLHDGCADPSTDIMLLWQAIRLRVLIANGDTGPEPLKDGSPSEALSGALLPLLKAPLGTFPVPLIRTTRQKVCRGGHRRLLHPAGRGGSPQERSPRHGSEKPDPSCFRLLAWCAGVAWCTVEAAAPALAQHAKGNSQLTSQPIDLQPVYDPARGWAHFVLCTEPDRGFASAGLNGTVSIERESPYVRGSG